MHPPSDPVVYAIALVGSACFAVTYRVPRRYFLPTALVGALAHLAMRSWPHSWHIAFATFVTALVIGGVSHVLARVTSAPAQCFLIPGVIYLVPGTVIYRAFSSALAGDIPEATQLGLAAITIASGISFGLLVANWLVPSRKTL